MRYVYVCPYGQLAHLLPIEIPPIDAVSPLHLLFRLSLPV